MQVLAWTPSEFWRSTVYEFETAILALKRASEPAPFSDDQVEAFFKQIDERA